MPRQPQREGRSQVPGALENLVMEIPIMEVAPDNLPTLAELFDRADEIGDKYLTPEEIAARGAEMTALLDELADEIYDDE